MATLIRHVLSHFHHLTFDVFLGTLRESIPTGVGIKKPPIEQAFGHRFGNCLRTLNTSILESPIKVQTRGWGSGKDIRLLHFEGGSQEASRACDVVISKTSGSTLEANGNPFGVISAHVSYLGTPSPPKKDR